MEVAMIDDVKAEILRTVFWEKNTITHGMDESARQGEVKYLPNPVV